MGEVMDILIINFVGCSNMICVRTLRTPQIVMLGDGLFSQSLT